MITNIVRIGNSRGIRLPKSILDQCRLEDRVEIEVEDNTLIIKPANAPRCGWENAFRGMAQYDDDKLLDADAGLSKEWDESEWRW